MTTYFIQLDKRIREIGVNLQSLLPPDPLTHNDSKSQDIIKAYILLCHAEFEQYFESIVQSGLTMIESQIDSISLYNTKQKDALHYSCNSSKSIIENNNGIKWSNIKKMFPIIGFDISAIDDIYTTKLNEFGNKRGLVAHNGSTGISTCLSFSDEKGKVEWLVNETKILIDDLL